MDEKATAKGKLMGLSLPFARKLPSPESETARRPGIARSAAGWLASHYLQLLALALVGSVISFGVYYYIDRQVDPGPTLIERKATALEEAVRNEPSSLSARLALAAVYEGSGNPAGALEQYNAALEIQPDDIQATLGLGRSQQATGDLAGATATFEKIVAERKDTEFAGMDDALRDASYYLGEIYIAEGDYGKAIESLQVALSIDRVDADAWWKLCEAFLGAGDHASALNACKGAITLVPNFTEVYQLMAQVHQGLNQPTQSQYATAMVSYTTGDPETAVASLRAVVQAAPDFWDGYVGLGLSLEAAGERDQAVAAFQKALSGDPENMLAQMGVNRLTDSAPPGSTGGH